MTGDVEENQSEAKDNGNRSRTGGVFHFSDPQKSFCSGLAGCGTSGYHAPYRCLIATGTRKENVVVKFCYSKVP